MLKVILNRLKPQAEEIITEEHTGFRARWSTTEQIFNLRTLCEKYFKHQQMLYNLIIDFKKKKKKKKKKKACNTIWRSALPAVIRKYSIVAAPPQPAITVVLLKRQGRWCSHNETLWIRPGSYSMLSGSEIRTGHFVVLQIY